MGIVIRSLFLASIAGFAASAYAENDFNLGIEGFRDNYREYGIDASGVDPNVDIHTNYGSVTAGYMHVANGYFSAVDGRYSSGSADYKSISGVGKGIPEFETDFRLRAGMDIPTTLWHGHLMPYIGVGWRYYFQQGKGLFTEDGGGAFYDRHISQFYIPVGTTYRFTSGDWTFSPNAEADVLFYGQVNSHFQAIDQFLAGPDQEPNISNRQSSGFGLRGEFMVGQQYKSFGWEVGPFIRYWHIGQSDLVMTPNTAPGGLLEPTNARIQAGAAARVNF